MAIRAKTPARPLRRAPRLVARLSPRKPERSVDGAAMMRRWARHWLRGCRDMPSQALALLDHAEQPPEQRIHAFRRLMKAWRALLKLAPDALAGEARLLRVEVRGLRQAFGALRDAAVVAGTLGRLLPAGATGAQARPEQPDLPRQLEPVRAKLGRLSAEMDRWSVAREDGAFLLAGFRRSYRKARRRFRADPREMSVKRLHAWRTTIVDLGYQLGFFQPADPAGLKPRLAAAETLRAHLGTIVDLDMARTHLAGTVPARRRARAEKEIGRSIAARRRKAVRIAGDLLEDRPKVICARLAGRLATRQPRRVKLV